MNRNVAFFFLFLSTVLCQESFSQPGRRQDSTDVILRFGGDLLLASRYEKGVGGNRHTAFTGFDLFNTDDISMVNMEVPVTVRGIRQKKPFTFRMKPLFLDVLTAAGIDVVNIANNHIYDFGKQGLFDTITYLDSVNLPHVGAGKNRDEAHRPFIKTIKGRKIGFLGYYRGTEAPAASKKSAGAALRDLKFIRRDIRSLREKDSVDFIVINFHWGREKSNRPETTQRVFAHKVIDAGADAIIGHHPHVLQGIELYKNKVIAYSLGNLVFGGNSRHTYDTGVFEIRLAKDSAAYAFIPVRITEWKASVLTEAAADSLLSQMRNLSSIFRKSIFH